ncbi:Protein FAR1-RELATED SEQUENCE 5 [Striga hermonthica]|uniref:Protein FAR1-RELATED SEQUENCE 5 n=1 Tax=Striga hermonthica TaxID=68872 RepID=A0A9N7NER9_STRHE|nr:Protein FAR1-RELATED SEQUENCE 5 [Striga hermonthica]
MNENGIIEEPTLGMVFGSQEEAYSYYFNYGIRKGFGVMKRSSKRGDDGVVRYFTFAGFKNDQKKKSTGKSSFASKLSTKTSCKAKIKLTLCDDGNIQVTTVHLDHDHLLSPGKARHFRCNRKIDDRVKRRLEINDEAGIGVSKNFHSLVVEANRYENVTFNEKDCRNHIEKQEEVSLVLKMLKQFTNGRSRTAYEAFGNVITFDTTYLTNKYKMPFAPFVGVNHHGQSVLFGCGLLTNEGTESFVWLF